MLCACCCTDMLRFWSPDQTWSSPQAVNPTAKLKGVGGVTGPINTFAANTPLLAGPEDTLGRPNTRMGKPPSPGMPWEAAPLD